MDPAKPDSVPCLYLSPQEAVLQMAHPVGEMAQQLGALVLVGDLGFVPRTQGGSYPDITPFSGHLYMQVKHTYKSILKGIQRVKGGQREGQGCDSQGSYKVLADKALQLEFDSQNYILKGKN